MPEGLQLRSGQWWMLLLCQIWWGVDENLSFAAGEGFRSQYGGSMLQCPPAEPFQEPLYGGRGFLRATAIQRTGHKRCDISCQQRDCSEIWREERFRGLQGSEKGSGRGKVLQSCDGCIKRRSTDPGTGYGYKNNRRIKEFPTEDAAIEQIQSSVAVFGFTCIWTEKRKLKTENSR